MAWRSKSGEGERDVAISRYRCGDEIRFVVVLEHHFSNIYVPRCDYRPSSPG